MYFIKHVLFIIIFFFFRLFNPDIRQRHTDFMIEVVREIRDKYKRNIRNRSYYKRKLLLNKEDQIRCRKTSTEDSKKIQTESGRTALNE